VRRSLLLVPLFVLAVASPAFGGGWATVGLSSTPAGVEPGKPWTVDMTILQHGRSPLEGVKPSLTIVNGDASKTFSAKPTGKPGVYRVAVTFPTAGKWSYQVDDGFISGQPHTFAAVQIGEPASVPAANRTTTAADDGGPSLIWLIGGVALLAAAAALLFARRPRHHHPQAA
jgi:MYXO-CTERM domain-containing protein